QVWDIDIETDRGTLKLSHGGSVMTVDGKAIAVPPQREYPALYRRFAQLIARGESEVDARPFRLVIDALARGKRVAVEAFDDKNFLRPQL
ncbi:MAG: gfo/Idh/MocA family oxidoreductase, partial [Rhizomicrobium sp.]